MALNSFAQQDTVNPEAIQPRFLNDEADGLPSGGPHHCAFDYDSGAHEFPERDQQLSRQRYDRRLAPTSACVRFGP